MADVSEELQMVRDGVREIEDADSSHLIAAHAVNAIGNVLLAILGELREANAARRNDGAPNA